MWSMRSEESELTPRLGPEPMANARENYWASHQQFSNNLVSGPFLLSKTKDVLKCFALWGTHICTTLKLKQKYLKYALIQLKEK